MSLFHFKHFSVNQTDCAMKIGTDAIVLGAWTETKTQMHNILDIGTGTGVLSLMMAQKYPESTIHAIEIDEKACIQAQNNFNQNSLGKNCSAFQGDFLQHDFTDSYDLIISNPPYFEDSTKANSQERSLARHNDTLPFHDFFKKTAGLLTENGTISIIIPSDLAIIQIAAESNLFPREILKVYGKSNQLKRFCIQFSKFRPEKTIENELIIRDEHGNYTAEYKKLTFDFHGVELR